MRVECGCDVNQRTEIGLTLGGRWGGRKGHGAGKEEDRTHENEQTKKERERNMRLSVWS